LPTPLKEIVSSLLVSKHRALVPKSEEQSMPPETTLLMFTVSGLEVIINVRGKEESLGPELKGCDAGPTPEKISAAARTKTKVNMAPTIVL